MFRDFFVSLRDSIINLKLKKQMAQGDQVKNGKAFEYAIATVYTEKLHQYGMYH